MAFRTSVLLLSALAGAFAQSASTTTDAGSISAAAPSGNGVVVSGTTVTQAIAATTAATSIDSALPQSPIGTAPMGFSIMPLASITSIPLGSPTDSTVALASTAAQGQMPTKVTGAPALPNPTLVVANYPTLDQIPPTNSSVVQEWLGKIDMSKVPTYNVTDGTCAGTPGAISDGRCWWTCGGCTRATDITECPDKYTWGLSYDDGPSPYTPLLLDYLDQQNITTTFFLVGSRVLSRPEIVQAEYVAGHQLSVHTWSHPYLTKLTNEEVVAELAWTMKVIYDSVGVTPNTFRPPYGDIDDRVRAIAAQMGLTPIIWTSVTTNGVTTDFDTTDWNIPGGEATGESSLAKFELILEDYVPQLSAGFIVLEHDLYQQTVDLAVGYVLPMAIASGNFTLKSIISCLGRPLSEAYIETSSNTTATAITSASTTAFQAVVGSATGSPVSATGTGSTGGSSGGSSGDQAKSSSSTSSATSSSTSSAAAGRRAAFDGMALLPVLYAMVGVGACMALLV